MWLPEALIKHCIWWVRTDSKSFHVHIHILPIHIHIYCIHMWFGFWILRLITPWINPLWYPIDLKQNSGLFRREVSYPNPPMLCNDFLVEAECTFKLIFFQNPKSGKNTKKHINISTKLFKDLFQNNSTSKPLSLSDTIWLVVSTHLKNMRSNWKSSPTRGENKKCLKPPSSENRFFLN